MLTIPQEAQKNLKKIPKGFKDDGCTNSPDKLFGFNFKWACQIHDWRYCSRCHEPRNMRHQDKVAADRELRKNIKSSLPFRWRWVAFVYYTAVWRYGGLGSWDSCLTTDKKCRHNVGKPKWMASS
jgi:hypothetical protein